MNINDKVQLIGSRSYTGIIKELFYEREKIYCKINWDDNFTSTVNINELNKIKPPLTSLLKTWRQKISQFLKLLT